MFIILHSTVKNGDITKKLAVFILIILTASVLVPGCTSPAQNTPTPTTGDHTPSVMPTQAPLPTDKPAPTPVAYDTGKLQKNPLVNGVMVQFPTVYRAEDWMMPIPQTGKAQAHHGAILELYFENPTNKNQTVTADSDLKAHITYQDENHMTHWFVVYDVFYDPKKGFYGAFDIAPGERKKVMMYAYIVDDEAYEAHKHRISEQVSLDVNPVR